MSSNDVSEFDSFLTFEQCMCLLVGKGLEGSTSKVCGGSFLSDICIFEWNIDTNLGSIVNTIGGGYVIPLTSCNVCISTLIQLREFLIQSIDQNCMYS